MGGITGEIYRQFALTLSVSVCISSVVALTLTPALCRMLLRHRGAARGPISKGLALFSRFLERSTGVYGSVVAAFVRRSILTIVAVFVLATTGGGDIERTLATLAVFAYVGLRLQPIIQKMIGFLNTLNKNQAVVEVLIADRKEIADWRTAVARRSRRNPASIREVGPRRPQCAPVLPRQIRPGRGPARWR